MNNAEQMAKLRAIVAGEANKREKLDEMFQYPRDKSPEGQRAMNAPQDALAKRGSMENPIAKDPAGYKGMVKGTAKLFGTTAKDVYKMHGPKGVLPEEDMNGDNELDALMKKYGVMEEGTCNMTAEGEKCPVHGMAECSMEEDIHITVDGNEADDMIARLMQLAGNGDKDVDQASDMALDISPDVSALDIDGPAMASTDDGYVCDDCGHDLEGCECGSEACPDCGHADCQCDMGGDMTTSYHGIVDSEGDIEEDHDYGHAEAGGEIDPSKFIYKAPKLGQRLSRQGMMGDNPLAEQRTSRYMKLAKDYAAYVAEAKSQDLSNAGETKQLAAVKKDGYAIRGINNPNEKVQIAAVKQNSNAIKFIKNPSSAVQQAAKKSMTEARQAKIPNESGAASPLTSADRAAFDKDPHKGKKPKDKMSPFSQIKRQDVMK